MWPFKKKQTQDKVNLLHIKVKDNPDMQEMLDAMATIDDLRKEPKTKKEKGLRALIFEGNEYYFEDSAPQKGTPYNWQGQEWVETFERNKEGVLVPFNLNALIPVNTIAPDFLYQGLRWKAEVKAFFKLPQGWMDKVKAVLIVILIIVLIVFLFLLATSLKGQGNKSSGPPVTPTPTVRVK